jgi:hypothetical protein
MANLVLKDGTKLQCDLISDKVTVNGKEDKNWSPAFVPSDTDEPDFFGFVNLKSGVCYDIYGGVHPITDEKKIKI